MPFIGPSAAAFIAALTASLVTIAALLARTRTQTASSPIPPAAYQIFWSRFVAASQPPWVIFSNANFVGRPQTNMHYFNPSTDSREAILGYYTGVGEVLAIHELDRVFGLLNRQLRVKHVELLENSPRRFACQFENQACLLQLLKRLSRGWPRLTFLLDFENEQQRIKGLAKAEAGELEHCKINY